MTRTNLTRSLAARLVSLAGIALLVAAMGGSWAPAAAAPPGSAASPSWSATTPPGSRPAAKPPSDAPDDASRTSKSARKELTGKLNLNTATEDQLMLLPTVGPAKAERIVT